MKTKNIVGVGLFTAIVVVLQLLGGGIKFGMFSISLVLIPIVVGAAVYGWGAGAWLGFAFGVTVLLSGDAAAFMVVDPIATVLVVLVKGTMCGLCSGICYRVLSRKNEVAGVMIAAVVCPVVNTGLFLLGCQLFFIDTIAQWAAAAGFASVGNYMIIGLAGFNFLFEVCVNLILAPVITRIIHLARNK